MLCDSSQSQLLVIDIQERLAAAMSAGDLARVERNTGILLDAARLLDIPVLRTEQYVKGLGPTTAMVMEHMDERVRVYEKTTFSCCGAEGFCETGIDSGRGQVVIAGMETHVCVLQTAFELQARGHRVFVVEDAVCSRHEDNRRNAIERMRQGGIVVTNTESVCFEWLRDARHEHFKAVSRLVK